MRADTRRATRAAGGKDNIVKSRSSHEFRANFFSNRVVDEWNQLPDTIKGAQSAAQFKRLYRRHQEGTVAPAVEG